MESKTYTIDASGKILGRLAVEISILLRGKNRADFAPHKLTNDVVIIENVEKIKVTGKKMDQKTYFKHSGYLGSEKHIPLKIVFNKDPAEVLRRAVFGMLPKNKLRARAIKRLKFNNAKRNN